MMKPPTKPRVRPGAAEPRGGKLGPAHSKPKKAKDSTTAKTDAGAADSKLPSSRCQPARSHSAPVERTTVKKTASSKGKEGAKTSDGKTTARSHASGLRRLPSVDSIGSTDNVPSYMRPTQATLAKSGPEKEPVSAKWSIPRPDDRSPTEFAGTKVTQKRKPKPSKPTRAGLKKSPGVPSPQQSTEIVTPPQSPPPPKSPDMAVPPKSPPDASPRSPSVSTPPRSPMSPNTLVDVTDPPHLTKVEKQTECMECGDAPDVQSTLQLSVDAREITQPMENNEPVENLQKEDISKTNKDAVKVLETVEGGKAEHKAAVVQENTETEQERQDPPIVGELQEREELKESEPLVDNPIEEEQVSTPKDKIVTVSKDLPCTPPTTKVRKPAFPTEHIYDCSPLEKADEPSIKEAEKKTAEVVQGDVPKGAMKSTGKRDKDPNPVNEGESDPPVEKSVMQVTVETISEATENPSHAATAEGKQEPLEATTKPAMAQSKGITEIVVNEIPVDVGKGNIDVRDKNLVEGAADGAAGNDLKDDVIAKDTGDSNVITVKVIAPQNDGPSLVPAGGRDEPVELISLDDEAVKETNVPDGTDPFDLSSLQNPPLTEMGVVTGEDPFDLLTPDTKDNAQIGIILEKESSNVVTSDGAQKGITTANMGKDSSNLISIGGGDVPEVAAQQIAVSPATVTLEVANAQENVSSELLEAPSDIVVQKPKVAAKLDKNDPLESAAPKQGKVDEEQPLAATTKAKDVHELKPTNNMEVEQATVAEGKGTADVASNDTKEKAKVEEDVNVTVTNVDFRGLPVVETAATPKSATLEGQLVSEMVAKCNDTPKELDPTEKKEVHDAPMQENGMAAMVVTSENVDETNKVAQGCEQSANALTASKQNENEDQVINMDIDVENGKVAVGKNEHQGAESDNLVTAAVKDMSEKVTTENCGDDAVKSIVKLIFEKVIAENTNQDFL